MVLVPDVHALESHLHQSGQLAGQRSSAWLQESKERQTIVWIQQEPTVFDLREVTEQCAQF